jgi:hypothetical protein
MPHPSDIGVDLNNYLAALGKYNLAYGPQPQGTGGTAGQNFAVRSSTEAPGFGYVNPETDELFPLYPDDPSGQGSKYGGVQQSQFHDYLASIGAQQQSIGHGNLRPTWDNEAGTLTHNIGGQTYWDYGGGGPNTYAGIPQKQYSFGEHTQAGVGARSGYVDPSGGFLGYGDDSEELFAKSSPLLRRNYYDSLYGSNAPPVEGV